MNISINVDPVRLETSAASIEQQIASYEKNYAHLYQCVDVLSQGWKGKDNLTFTNQIHGFEHDFKQMVLLMRQYAQFLRQSAGIYRKTQDERTQMAKRLSS